MRLRPRTLYIVRHGQTEWNAERRMQGQWDSRLSADGRVHADQSGRFLAQAGIEAVWASPLGRVQETAAIIRRHLDLAPTNDDRLKEWSSGDWSGYLYSEIAEKWPAAFAAWQADMVTVRAPGGENFLDLLARAQSFLTDIDAHPAERVAVLAHGFLNRALACAALDFPIAETLRVRQGNDVIICLRIGDNPEASHFRAGEGPYPGLPTESWAPVA